MRGLCELRLANAGTAAGADERASLLRADKLQAQRDKRDLANAGAAPGTAGSAGRVAAVSSRCPSHPYYGATAAPATPTACPSYGTSVPVSPAATFSPDPAYATPEEVAEGGGAALYI